MIKIGHKEIGHHTKPFIIAEMSGNHNQSLERALHLVELAAEAGVDALKLQTYTPDTITLDVHTGEFFIQDDANLWKGNSLYNLYKEAYTPWEWHKEIFNKAKELGYISPSSDPNSKLTFGQAVCIINKICNYDVFEVKPVFQYDTPIFTEEAIAINTLLSVNPNVSLPLDPENCILTRGCCAQLIVEAIKRSY